jgi:arylsulfatase
VPDDYLDRYAGRYDQGYDVIRARRLARQKRLGLIPRDLEPNPRLPATPERPSWEQLTPEQRQYEARRQELFAALVENLDFHVGRLIKHLKAIGEYENTFIFFQSDNGPEGANVDDEEADNSLENLGKAGSYVGYGLRWAEVSATPLRLWKQFATEGGASVPAIARVPRGWSARSKLAALTHVTDVVPTLLDVAGIDDPGSEYGGRSVHPISGVSLLNTIVGWTSRARGRNEVLADEQYGHRYAIRDHWKALRLGPPFGPSEWALYDLRNDRGEVHDLSTQYPELRAELIAAWEQYAADNGVIPIPGGYGDL